MSPRSQLPTAEELRTLWRDSPRWRGIERPYSAEDVVRLRGTIAVEHSIARLTAVRDALRTSDTAKIASWNDAAAEDRRRLNVGDRRQRFLRHRAHRR